MVDFWDRLSEDFDTAIGEFPFDSKVCVGFDYAHLFDLYRL